MANEEHVAKLKEEVTAWNKWRKQYPEVQPDLSAADLNQADLRNANLYQADLSGAHLDGANLRGVNLSGTDLDGAILRAAHLDRAVLRAAHLRGATLNRALLRGAILSGADLSRAHLSGAILRGAILRRADLSGAILNGANLASTDLSGANFSNAGIGDTVFGNTDLSNVSGLETVWHSGPSTIGIDVIYLSKGKIPEAFLRGAGVPESFVTYMKSLAANPVEFYSCFISYSTKDQDFAVRLHADLQNKGVRCWFAPEDIQGGKKTHEQIDEAIRAHERLLLILSEHSMSSEWVKTEIAKARKREVQEKKKVLFPVSLVPFSVIRDWECFDADTGKDSAREIREYFIPDFSNWKDHDSYQSSFERLLRDLKAQQGT
jgi:hypothetical protein